MKRVAQWCVIIGLVGGAVFSTGCVSQEEYNTCTRRNETQRLRIEDLLSRQDEHALRGDVCEEEFRIFEQEKKQLADKIAALMATLEAKKALLEELTGQMGQIALPALPVELSNALAQWAEGTGGDLVTFNAATGIVRFKSDLLFDKGSDVVKDDHKELLKKLSEILNSPAAEGFDALIVGHTDDMRLGPATRARHYSNWHLSAHRAIAVKTVLSGAGLAETRMAVMGMGEHRPIEPNKANKAGNPKNRRVEIYVVPAGRIAPLSGAGG